MKIAMGSDHAGFPLKEEIKKVGVKAGWSSPFFIFRYSLIIPSIAFKNAFFYPAHWKMAKSAVCYSFWMKRQTTLIRKGFRWIQTQERIGSI